MLTLLATVFQTIGGALFVAAAQSAFLNTLINKLPEFAPGVDPAQVILTGATQIRVAFPEDVVPGILLSYMAGLKVAFAIAIAGTGIAFSVGLFSRWERINPEALAKAGGSAA